MADLQTSVAELTGVLAHTAFLKPYQFKVLSCAPGECVLKILFQIELERPGGLVSGMTLMGAGDVAMWLAIMTLRGVAETWVTTDMRTAFLRSARQEDVMCTAKVLKLGRRTELRNVLARPPVCSHTMCQLCQGRSLSGAP